MNIDENEIEKVTEKITGFSYVKSGQTKNDSSNVKERQIAEITEEEAMDFFNNIGKDDEEGKSGSKLEINIKSSHFIQPEEQDNEVKTISINKDWNKGLEKLIKKNILVNNVEGALDLALKANRVFEAFMIAYYSNENRDQYINYLIERVEDGGEFLKSFLIPVANRDFSQILTNYPISEWKDLLTFIIKNFPSFKDRIG